jgi:hypothetical protein
MGPLCDWLPNYQLAWPTLGRCLIYGGIKVFRKKEKVSTGIFVSAADAPEELFHPP